LFSTQKGWSGIPGFWLTAMQNLPQLNSVIREHDQPILACLEDIILTPDPDGIKEIFLKLLILI